KKYFRDWETFQVPDELREVHSLKKSPVVVITDPSKGIATPLVLPESGAIVSFLIHLYSPATSPSSLALAPDASPYDQAEHSYFMHWVEGTAMQPVMYKLVLSRLPKLAPWYLRPLVQSISDAAVNGVVKGRAQETYQYVDDKIGDKEFFVGGKLTGVDIMMSFFAETLATAAGVTEEDFPRFRAWHAKMKQRPAYQKALGKGGENDLGLFTK
ncbi:hypothetical protein JCM11641_000330, partial [Rhodosporidiobolus odoratus]